MKNFHMQSVLLKKDTLSKDFRCILLNADNEDKILIRIDSSMFSC